MYFICFRSVGHTMAQVVSSQPLTMQPWVPFPVSPCGICSGHSGTGTGFSLSTAVFPCQYHWSNTLYSILMLYYLSNWECHYVTHWKKVSQVYVEGKHSGNTKGDGMMGGVKEGRRRTGF